MPTSFDFIMIFDSAIVHPTLQENRALPQLTARLSPDEFFTEPADYLNRSRSVPIVNNYPEEPRVLGMITIAATWIASMSCKATSSHVGTDCLARLIMLSLRLCVFVSFCLLHLCPRIYLLQLDAAYNSSLLFCFVHQ